MSFNVDTPPTREEQDNARTARDHRSTASETPAHRTTQPGRSALTALPDMNPYHHGPSRHTETVSPALLRGQWTGEVQHEQQARSETPLRFSQRFAPPGLRDLSANGFEYESQASPFGPSYSESRVAPLGLHQPQESQSATEQQYQQPIPPAVALHGQQHRRQDAPPMNAPRGPANHRRNQHHTLAPYSRSTTPTPPSRSGDRYQGRLQRHQHQQDVSQHRPTHAHAQTRVAPVDIPGPVGTSSHGSLPRHILGRPCPLGDRNCHIHHGVACHQYWAHCPLARKAIGASFLAHNSRRGAPEGWNEEHERCVAGDARPGDMCAMHRRLYTDALPAIERSLLGGLLQE